MDGTMKPVGILLAIAGNIMVAIAFPAVFGSFEGGDGRDLARYVPMLIVGLGFAGLAIRIGGARLAFFALFLSIGLGSLWTAFTSDDAFDRSLGFIFGGIFVGVTLLSLLIRLLAGRLRSALPFGATGGGLSPDMLTLALGQLETLHAQGQLSDAQLSAAQSSLRGVPPSGSPSPAISHPEAIGQLDALHAQGLITDDQLKTVKMWWGVTPPA
jgi:hypothetical protein